MNNALRLHEDIQFQTPYFVAKYMASLIPDRTKTILEPTPGIGNLIAAIQEVRSDISITAPDDFFLLPKQRFDCIVMNPPFTSKSADLSNAPEDAKQMGMRLGYHILLKCMEMSDYIIALMPWFTIADSDLRLKVIKEFGLKSVTPLLRKTFRYARIQTCVIEMEKGFKGQTILRTEFH